MSTPNFLDLPEAASAFDGAGALVLPVPYEATVTYGRGTAGGPAAILEASAQVELYDRELGSEPALEHGVHTLPAVEPPAEPAEAVAAIAGAVSRARGTRKLVVVLGGEHAITAGVVRGLIESGDTPLTVVQLDAHCDLRDEYAGSPYNHACVARRLLDETAVEQVLQLGVRSVDVEEVEFARAHPDRVRTWYAEQVHENTWRNELAERVSGRRVHLTLDVDALDPAVVPATGTPEPDGLGWRQALDIVRTTAYAGRIVAIDCVELAPRPGQHAADFAVAKLLYKAMTYAMDGNSHA
jgi:agmatinase